MSFPCSHCGSEESFADRKTDDFKPIVPIELQGDFEEPPEFVSDPSLTPSHLSTESKPKPVSKAPEPKKSLEAPPTSTIVPSPKSDVKPGTLEGPPILKGPLKMPHQGSTSSKGVPIKEAHGISHVVERMVTKTEDTDYRAFVKNHLLEIESTIQSIKTDIQSLIEGQKRIESMLIEKEEQELEKKKEKKGRWRK